MKATAIRAISWQNQNKDKKLRIECINQRLPRALQEKSTQRGAIFAQPRQNKDD